LDALLPFFFAEILEGVESLSSFPQPFGFAETQKKQSFQQKHCKMRGPLRTMAGGNHAPARARRN